MMEDKNTKENKENKKNKKSTPINERVVRRIKGLDLRKYYIILVLIVFLAAVTVSTGLVAVLDKVIRLIVSVPNIIWVISVCIIVCIVIVVFTNKKILTPIAKLEKAMGKVSKGDFKIRLETKSKIVEIKNAYDSFNIMAKELESTEILQTDFVSNVSHEFKTPINAIEGYAMLLQGDQVSDEQAEYIDKILYNTKRLTDLIGGILLLSKIENQAIADRAEHFSLDEQIRKAIVALEIKWMKREIDFDANLDEITYLGNQSLLSHVWLNLIDNAIKFSPYKGTISLRLFQSDDEVVFTISDQGPGISESDKTHIFDKFYQGDSSHSSEGTGLGLTLVMRILKLYNGTIEVNNNDDVGCIFTVKLPLISK